MNQHRYAVVGGGIIGIAVAREIFHRVPGAQVTVFEKEPGPALHQSGHNSGVVHAGLYYEPGSLKAQLCRRGNELLRTFCREHRIGYDECGKIVVAQNEAERARLAGVYDRAVANGVPGAQLIGPAEIGRIEPAATGVAALYSPHTAIINYADVTRALAADVQAAGGTIRYATEVTRLEPATSGVRLFSRGSNSRGGNSREANGRGEGFDAVITCAGLQSDRLARSSGDRKTPQIIPFYGDYFVLRPEKRDLINGLVYPVPDPRYPFLGVHLTKRIDGEVLVGPNAFLSVGRESYRHRLSRWPLHYRMPRRRDLADLAQVAMFPGFWRFAARNIPAAILETGTAVSSRRFIGQAATYVPAIGPGDAVPAGRGIRAQAMDLRGILVDDFAITSMGRLTHVRNAPSPGATSALAIAEHVVGRALAATG